MQGLTQNPRHRRATPGSPRFCLCALPARQAMAASPRPPGTKGTLCHPEGPHHRPRRPPFPQHECGQAAGSFQPLQTVCPGVEASGVTGSRRSSSGFTRCSPVVFSAKTAKCLDLDNRFLPGVAGRGYRHHPFTDYLPNPRHSDQPCPREQPACSKQREAGECQRGTESDVDSLTGKTNKYGTPTTCQGSRRNFPNPIAFKTLQGPQNLTGPQVEGAEPGIKPGMSDSETHR